MSKIYIDKFVASLMKHYYDAHNIDRRTTKGWFDDALEEQGLEYKDGEIVKTQRRVAAEAKEAIFDEEDEKIKEMLIDSFTRADMGGEIYGKGVTYKQVIAWLEKQGQKSIDMSIKEKAHQIAWETSKHYDPLLSKESWCEMAALDMASWLKKQGEQKPAESTKDYHDIDPHFGIPVEDLMPKEKTADEVKPKFKVGDWVVCDVTGSIYQIKTCIENLSNHRYGYDLTNGGYIGSDEDNHYHLWTIQDAKEGDVLSYVTDEEDLWIMIYWSLYEPYEGHVHYHALLVNDNFGDKGTCCICIDNLKPATKEQRDLLFSKMKEAGYSWDSDKKEIRKTCQKPNYCHHEVDETGWTEEYRKAYYDGWNNCNQQHAQLEAQRKPTWSEDDEQYLLVCKNALAKYQTSDKWDASIISQWLENKIKGKVQPKQMYWTEEEIEPIISDYLCGREHYGGMIGRLRCLKPKQKSKWSKEDECNLRGIIDEIQVNKNNAPDCDIKTYDRFLNWLKSLTERLKGE